mmetsp:Transcript_6115/g.8906  ORF Transcript_6115/g.8906 Transcript_6115/m.8906 type:complete len:230 (+) Transcript_6115:20-709(+)
MIQNQSYVYNYCSKTEMITSTVTASIAIGIYRYFTNIYSPAALFWRASIIASREPSTLIPNPFSLSFLLSSLTRIVVKSLPLLPTFLRVVATKRSLTNSGGNRANETLPITSPPREARKSMAASFNTARFFASAYNRLSITLLAVILVDSTYAASASNFRFTIENLSATSMMSLACSFNGAGGTVPPYTYHNIWWNTSGLISFIETTEDSSPNSSASIGAQISKMKRWA